MTHDKYILDADGNPQPEDDLMKWGNWLQNSGSRIVKKERIGESEVSTIFLGIDHSFGDSSEPVLWETMVFGGKLNQEMARCPGSKKDAEAMHARMVERVKANAV